MKKFNIGGKKIMIKYEDTLKSVLKIQKMTLDRINKLLYETITPDVNEITLTDWEDLQVIRYALAAYYDTVANNYCYNKKELETNNDTPKDNLH